MDNWPMRGDDRPYFRPRRRKRTWAVALGIALIAGLLAGYCFYLLQRQGPPVAPPPLLGSEPQSVAAPSQATD